MVRLDNDPQYASQDFTRITWIPTLIKQSILPTEQWPSQASSSECEASITRSLYSTTGLLGNTFPLVQFEPILTLNGKTYPSTTVPQTPASSSQTGHTFQSSGNGTWQPNKCRSATSTSIIGCRVYQTFQPTQKCGSPQEPPIYRYEGGSQHPWTAHGLILWRPQQDKYNETINTSTPFLKVMRRSIKRTHRSRRNPGAS